MAGKVLEFDSFLSSENKAAAIAHKWTTSYAQKQEFNEEWKELRKFLFATDTRHTLEGKTQWRNSTTIPKLTNIRDNLHSNYLSGIFPNDDWLRWEAYGVNDDDKAKREAIEAYIANKSREGDLKGITSMLLYDYIDHGNAFAESEFVSKSKDDPEESGLTIPQFVGPRAKRINPNDIVFNLAAPSFESSPKIIRELTTVGELLADAEDLPEDSSWKQAVAKAQKARLVASGWGKEDADKAEGIHIDGFGNYQEYLQSGLVEILRFVGDWHDLTTGEFKRNQEIYVIDRAFVAEERDNPSWLGQTIFHVGWRKRPDNLWAMGPLANLIGMQYRIDHLENMKSDVFDMVGTPIAKIRGDVPPFEIKPGSEILLDEGDDVDLWSPDSQALGADFQIERYINLMELFAGAPREAMGFRTPGEKTAFEVDQLATAAGRIFQEKIDTFEEHLLEPLLNSMLERARRNMEGSDVVRVFDDEFGMVMFNEVTKEDITARGVLRPVGARHFSNTNRSIRELSTLLTTPLGQKISPHINSKKLAVFVEDQLGLDRYTLFMQNADIIEGAERQQAMSQIQEELAVEQEQSLANLEAQDGAPQ
jgi:hypothetical protein